MVVERISLYFVGYIATHHSHTSSIEPILISVLTSTINSAILLFLVEDNFFGLYFSIQFQIETYSFNKAEEDNLSQLLFLKRKTGKKIKI
jgi:hypothetical protein